MTGPTSPPPPLALGYIGMLYTVGKLLKRSAKCTQSGFQCKSTSEYIMGGKRWSEVCLRKLIKAPVTMIQPYWLEPLERGKALVCDITSRSYFWPWSLNRVSCEIEICPLARKWYHYYWLWQSLLTESLLIFPLFAPWENWASRQVQKKWSLSVISYYTFAILLPWT